MNKKILCAIATVAMVVASAFSAFAAPGINENEQAVLDYGSAFINLAASKGVVTTSYQSILEQVRVHFKDNTDLTREDAIAIAAEMNNLAETYAAIPDLATKLNSGEINGLSAVATSMNKVSKITGLKAAVNADGSIQIVPEVATPDAKPENGTNDVIKQTGIDMSSAVMMIAGAAGAIGACGFVAKKKQLF